MDLILQLFKHKDLRNRILVTFLLLFIFRLVVFIPIPIISSANLAQLFANNPFLGLVDIFTGGSLANFSIAMMGVAPYINAAIIMQLMTMAIPSLETLYREGDYGRRKVNQYTRYLTVPLAILQSYGTVRLIQNSQPDLLPALSTWQMFALVLIATAGTIFLMWLGELITEYGIGNGISLIIFVGIIARLPSALASTLVLADVGKIISLIVFGLVAFLTVLFVVYITEGQRKVPISYGGRGASGRLLLSGTNYLPIRVNQAGVIPIIFALSLLLFPGLIASFFAAARSAWLASAATFVQELFQQHTFYAALYFLLVAFFTYFYTWVVFNPDRVTDHLHKQGGFIPGIRPGPQTREYLSYLINRLTLAGAIFLGFIAIMPIVVQAFSGLPSLTIGGTSLLIVVSVALEVMRQVQSMLITKRYDV